MLQLLDDNHAILLMMVFKAHIFFLDIGRRSICCASFKSASSDSFKTGPSFTACKNSTWRFFANSKKILNNY